MSNVVFVAPFFFDTTLHFVAAAADHPGCRLGLVSQDPIDRLPRSLARKLAGHWRVPNALDVEQLVDAVSNLRRKLGTIDRLLGTLEHLQVPLAAVREHLGIPGMGVEVARRFRDKAHMKDILRAAGVPCARHRLLARPEDAWAFAEEVGYPLVLKPPAGAGAKGTVSVADAGALRAALAEHPPRPEQPLLAEEMIRGSEHSFDAVSIDGRMVWHSLTHYLPTPLDVVQNPWIQWCVLLPREIDHPRYDDVRAVAARALEVLGMETGASHLEWFRREDGSIAISEVGARPGGAQISRLISYAHEFHFYRAWARLMIDGTFVVPRRVWSAGAAYLRGQGEGRRVKAIHGLRRAQEEIGHLVVESNLPRLGQPASGSYEGEGYVILRHRDTEVVKRALYRLISLVRVELG
ncbi:MAG: ATP-grasp domain-containing protein [Acidobacteria bacterium]|nr:MAG: ATP-grasp domain-containing protein [Acidobacteriota bacterium]